MNIASPQPSGTKTGKGSFTIDISQIIRNFTGAETDDDKKSVLQKLLEPKEVDDSEKEAKKALQIAKKIARGDSVTPEEKQFLMRVNPQLAQMAELARKEGERIKHALQQAASKEEQQTIVQQAYQQVSEVTKSNPQFGMLLGEAVKAAIQEAQKDPKCQDKPEKEEEPNHTGSKGPIGRPKAKATESEDKAGKPISLPIGEQKAIALERPMGHSKAEEAQNGKECPITENSPEITRYPEPNQVSGSVPIPHPEEPSLLEQQEEILEQFYPEEWISMLDCKG